MAAVGEDVFLLRVGVEVDEHHYSALVVEDIFFNQVDLSAVVGFGRPPGSVEVVACDVAPRIAQDDSVGVEHRDYFYYAVLEQFVYDVAFLLLYGVDQEELV